MAKYLPAHLKGKTPTAAHNAANETLLRAHIPAGTTPLTESEAFAMLHAWLQANMPESNRYQFGDYVKLWLRRRQKTISNDRSADSAPRQSLYDVIISTFPDSPALTHINLGLGSDKIIIQSFWQQPERLQLTLDFIELPASWVLQDLNIVTPLDLSVPAVPASPEVLALLDSFWQQGKRQWGPNKLALKQFGDWIKTHFLNHPGQKGQFAVKLATVTAWSTSDKAQTGYSNAAGASLSQLLVGRSGTWSIAMLHILAQFASQTTGKNYTPERLATEYANWRKKQLQAA